MARFELPPLGFSPDALQPHLSAETFEYHHGKHHKAYVDKLNALLEGHALAGASLEEIVRQSDGVLFNQAAQHFNHSFYWQCIAPRGGDAPTGALETAIDGAFGSFASFREKFTAAALGVFGSGWTWLAKGADGSLAIESTANAGCPLTGGKTPLLTCDVWEHAYYVDYRNARPKYVEAFWSLVNWEHVAAQHAG
jgi:Fe-Mn family superoxide dismutase